MSTNVLSIWTHALVGWRGEWGDDGSCAMFRAMCSLAAAVEAYTLDDCEMWLFVIGWQRGGEASGEQVPGLLAGNTELIGLQWSEQRAAGEGGSGRQRIVYHMRTPKERFCSSLLVCDSCREQRCNSTVAIQQYRAEWQQHVWSACACRSYATSS